MINGLVILLVDEYIKNTLHKFASGKKMQDLQA